MFLLLSFMIISGILMTASCCSDWYFFFEYKWYLKSNWWLNRMRPVTRFEKGSMLLFDYCFQWLYIHVFSKCSNSVVYILISYLQRQATMNMYVFMPSDSWWLFYRSCLLWRTWSKILMIYCRKIHKQSFENSLVQIVRRVKIKYLIFSVIIYIK